MGSYLMWCDKVYSHFFSQKKKKVYSHFQNHSMYSTVIYFSSFFLMVLFSFFYLLIFCEYYWLVIISNIILYECHNFTWVSKNKNVDIYFFPGFRINNNIWSSKSTNMSEYSCDTKLIKQIKIHLIAYFYMRHSGFLFYSFIYFLWDFFG